MASGDKRGYDNSPNLADEDIYLNLTIFNDLGNTNKVPAEYREERLQPILQRASDYKMSIVRFDLPTDRSRIFLFDTTLNHTVTYRDPVTGTTGTAAVAPIQTDFSAGAYPLSDPNNVYYFKQMIIGMNNAFIAAFADFIANYPGGNAAWTGTGGLDASQIPTVAFRDNESGLVSFYHRVEAGDSATAPLHLYLSSPLFDLFSFTYSEFYGYNLGTGLDYRIIFDDFSSGFELNRTQLPLTGPPTGDFYINQQEADTSGQVYETYKILIASESMPVRLEHVTLANKISDSGEDSKNVKLGILTDFNYEFDKASQTRANYTPSGEFRWTDLLSQDPLVKVDFKVYVENSRGQLIPVYLAPGDAFNMKVLFRKK